MVRLKRNSTRQIEAPKEHLVDNLLDFKALNHSLICQLIKFSVYSIRFVIIKIFIEKIFVSTKGTNANLRIRTRWGFFVQQFKDNKHLFEDMKVQHIRREGIRLLKFWPKRHILFYIMFGWRIIHRLFHTNCTLTI